VSDVPPLTYSSPESAGPAEVIPRLLFRFNVECFDFEEGFVDFYDPPDFKIGDVLGRGRNGDVFSGDFNGEAVAVKQFDLSKNFASYRRESPEGHPAIETCSLATLRVNGHFCGVTHSRDTRSCRMHRASLFPYPNSCEIPPDK
jgi:hypothetical protein